MQARTEAPGRDHVLEAVRTNVLLVLPDLDPALVVPDQNLTDLGCNSIDRADVVALTMEELGIDVPVVELADAGDIGSLVAILRRHVV